MGAGLWLLLGLGAALGGMWLRERPFLPCLLAAAMMYAGVALITLKG